MKTLTLPICLLLSIAAFAGGVLDDASLKKAAEMRDDALKGTRAYEIVESLTTEVGPRRAGTPGDTAGVKWAEAKLKELGFDKVWLEPVTFPKWNRGDALARITSPFPQPLEVTGLGYSEGTPDEGIEAEIVTFATLDDLRKADPEKVKGKIAFINHRMTESGDYGKVVPGRTQGAGVAASKGAVALLIRSVGTDSHRFPHTGVMTYPEGDSFAKIPAAAMSNPDANLIENMLKRGKPIVIRMHMTSRSGGMFTSHNVIGEITGSEKPEEVIVVGAHLDSWDLGTGALDDGAGVAIVTEAARIIGQLKQRPRRTIRVVLFANEESGIYGGNAYAETHKNDLDNHIIGAESDFGAGPVVSFMPRVSENALPTMKQIHSVLEPLGIKMGPNMGWGGPDLGPIRELGMPVATLRQDGRDYFHFHHTADDTLDKIDPKKLDQNVAAYVVFAYLTAQATIPFRDLETGDSVIHND